GAGGGSAQGARDPRGPALRPGTAAGRPHHRRPALRGPRSGARGAGRRRRRRSPPALLTAAQRRWAAGGLALGVLALSGPRAQTQSRSAVPVAIVYGGDATFAPYEYVDG